MKKLFFYGICALVLSACNSNKDSGKEQNIGDSITVDTTTDTTANTDYDAALALLKDIQVDKATFKQLYNNCRTKGDEFSDSKFLYDKTSPLSPNSNDIFIYLNETTPGLRLAIQYYANDKLSIKTVAFIIDGKTFNYSPPFKTDSGDGGHIWEWSDEAVSNAQLPLLVKLALGKQVSVKLTGAQRLDTKTLTTQQQQSIKNILMLYKGVLMGFNA